MCHLPGWPTGYILEILCRPPNSATQKVNGSVGLYSHAVPLAFKKTGALAHKQQASHQRVGLFRNDALCDCHGVAVSIGWAED